jgi:transposase
MAKSDLATRPIVHHAEDAVRSHVLLCFVGLVLRSPLERQTGLSARQLRDILWDVSEAHLFDALTGETHVLRSSLDEYRASRIYTLLGEPETH